MTAENRYCGFGFYFNCQLNSGVLINSYVLYFRYDKMMSMIMEWENEKKAKARSRLERKEVRCNY